MQVLETGIANTRPSYRVPHSEHFPYRVLRSSNGTCFLEISAPTQNIVLPDVDYTEEGEPTQYHFTAEVGNKPCVNVFLSRDQSYAVVSRHVCYGEDIGMAFRITRRGIGVPINPNHQRLDVFLVEHYAHQKKRRISDITGSYHAFFVMRWKDNTVVCDVSSMSEPYTFGKPVHKDKHVYFRCEFDLDSRRVTKLSNVRHW